MTEPPPTELDPERVARRMAGAAEPPPTDLDPDRPPPTDLDPDRAAGGRPHADDARGVPPELRARFTEIEPIGGETGQAELYRVREGGGPYQVLKIYLPRREPDPQIRDLLVGRRISPSLVHITEAGVRSGRHYELMEYIPGGDLYALRAALGGPPGPEMFREIVEHLAEAIDRLHELGIAHLDIKPGNVLLRTRPGERPVRPALIDFGISRYLDASDIPLPHSGTYPYMSPQAAMGVPGQESDWWSLGALCLELLTGEPPYGVTDKVVIRGQFAAGRPVPLDGVTDAAQQLLCRALLVQDPVDRWGYAQIRQWLDGAPPEAPETRRPEPARVDWALPYYGAEAHDRLELARLLEEDWDRAAARFFEPPVGDPWWQLSEWMAQFDGFPDGDADGRRRLARLAETKRHREPSYVLLLRLLNWLDPHRYPIYRGTPVTPAHLPTLAAQAISGERADAGQIIQDLQEHDVLRLLADCAGGAELAAIADRWSALGEQWDATPRELTKAGVVPEPAGSARTRPYLLWMAVDEPAVADWAGRRLRHIRAELDEEVAWFTALADSPDPVSRLRAVLLEEDARAESRRSALDRRAEAQRLAWERRRDAKVRWHRDQQRMLALGWAAAGGAVVLIVWSWVTGLCARLPLSSPQANDRAFTFAMLNLAVVLAGELSLALIMGGLYYQYREYALFGTLIRHGNRVLHPFRTNGWAALPIIVPVVVAVVLSTIYLPYLLPLVTGLAHLGWTLERHTRWHRRWRSLTPPAGPTGRTP